jgi:hypothetical protein
MLHNPALDWRQIDSNRLAVATGTGTARADVVFTLNPDGHIGSVRAEDRPRSATPPELPTPWEGEFSDYRLQHGRTVPFSAQVAWVIDGQRSLYWRGTMTDWTVAAAASAVPTPRPATLQPSKAGRSVPALKG